MPNESHDNTWPAQVFHFEVDFGEGQRSVPFLEVSGLDTESQIIEYHHDKPMFTTVWMPGISKMTNVTLKRGIFVNDNSFWSWTSEIKMNVVKRQTV